MHAFSAEHRQTILGGHSVVRLLIVSYFLALAFGIIEGTDMSVLASAVLPSAIATVTMSAMVIVLSMLILIGWHRRAAALVLALAVFWASYLTMMAAPDQNLGGFWRDLALIGALVMTYADGSQGSAQATRMPDDEQSTRPPSRIAQAIAGTRSVISRPTARTKSKGNSEKAELYRKDLDIVRAS